MRILAALAAVAGLTTPAIAYTAVKGLAVNPVPGGFEVVAQGSDGPRQICCAAGQYAREAAGGGRVYILERYGPSRTRPGWVGVGFTTHPSAELAKGPRLGDNGNYSVQLKARQMIDEQGDGIFGATPPQG